MADDPIAALESRFGADGLTRQATADGMPTVWVAADTVGAVLGHLRTGIDRPYRTLFDLTAIDERPRQHRVGQPAGAFTLVYHLMSYDRAADIRVKVALAGDAPALPSVTGLWPAADWYEREAWDMFGIVFDGHPNLRRILLPPTWAGHPLRKDHPARATEMAPFTLPEAREEAEQEALRVRPEDWGLEPGGDGTDLMILNLGPNHPSVHGVFRIVLRLDGEEIVQAVPDIGYHHRGAEKMGERQSWHSYIPYTDRVDYLGGVMNNLPYVLAVEALAGITVPERAQVIRVMLAELFRVASHLVFYGTMAQDVGALSPVFYMFTDRERIFDLIEAICGARMHPGWFRIGGVAQDLPRGWDHLLRDFLDYMPARLAEYDTLVMNNRLFKLRTKGIGAYGLDTALDWGAWIRSQIAPNQLKLNRKRPSPSQIRVSTGPHAWSTDPFMEADPTGCSEPCQAAFLPVGASSDFRQQIRIAHQDAEPPCGRDQSSRGPIYAGGSADGSAFAGRCPAPHGMTVHDPKRASRCFTEPSADSADITQQR